jgi:NADPH-dependent ferric siderophore reductase
MPTLPKFLADITAGSFMRKATVTEVHYYHEAFKKIAFCGEDLKKRDCKPGAQIEPRVSDTEFRHYNPSAYDVKKGTGEMLIYLHGNGPGSDWAEKLVVGDSIALMGPANKISLDTTRRKVVFLGDETAVGTFLFMQQGLEAGQQYAGAVETASELVHIPRLVGLNLPGIARQQTAGAALLSWLKENLEQHKDALFYLLGHSGTNKLLRNYLKEQDIPGHSIVTTKYWAEGRTGL